MTLLALECPLLLKILYDIVLYNILYIILYFELLRQLEVSTRPDAFRHFETLRYRGFSILQKLFSFIMNGNLW